MDTGEIFRAIMYKKLVGNTDGVGEQLGTLSRNVSKRFELEEETVLLTSKCSVIRKIL